MDELVARVHQHLVAAGDSWNKRTGRRKAHGLFRAVQIVCIYVRQNSTEELLGDLCGVSQPTVSRRVMALVPVVKAVLEEFVASTADALEMVQGRACLVDGTITPCWSWAEHPELWSRKHGTTGFNVQVVSLLDGRPVYVSEPLDGCTHDMTAFTETPVSGIVKESGGAIADKGYQGSGMTTPRKTPKGGELSDSDKKYNNEISGLRAAVERANAHIKSWRILHVDYRRGYDKYRETFEAVRALFFFAATWSFE
jgi:transposase